MRISNSITSWLIVMTFGTCLLIQACVEPFTPELNEEENVLVIDGAITDLPPPYKVQLSLSSSVYLPKEEYVKNAIVTIIEENGPEEILDEGQKGVYKSSETGIHGIPGRNYKIRIETINGNIYESPFQQLKKSTAIESIEPMVEYKFLGDDDGEIPGYQFYINTALSENDQDYFLWLQEGTFKYKSDYTMDFLYSDGVLTELPNPIAFMTCYKTYTIDEVNTYNTQNLATNKIENLPLTFLRVDDQLVRIRYSLLVKQFSVDKATYTYWNNIEGQIASLGALYASQPFQIRGNVSNINDSDETVLGYFMVAGLSEKRIFVDPPPNLFFEYGKCFLDYMGFGRIRFSPPRLWPIYVHQDDNGGRALADPGCIDCTEQGGKVEKPDFWED